MKNHHARLIAAAFVACFVAGCESAKIGDIPWAVMLLVEQPPATSTNQEAPHG